MFLNNFYLSSGLKMCVKDNHKPRKLKKQVLRDLGFRHIQFRVVDVEHLRCSTLTLGRKYS